MAAKHGVCLCVFVPVDHMVAKLMYFCAEKNQPTFTLQVATFSQEEQITPAASKHDQHTISKTDCDVTANIHHSQCWGVYYNNNNNSESQKVNEVNEVN